MCIYFIFLIVINVAGSGHFVRPSVFPAIKCAVIIIHKMPFMFVYFSKRCSASNWSRSILVSKSLYSPSNDCECTHLMVSDRIATPLPIGKNHVCYILTFYSSLKLPVCSAEYALIWNFMKIHWMIHHLSVVTARKDNWPAIRSISSPALKEVYALTFGVSWHIPLEDVSYCHSHLTVYGTAHLFLRYESGCMLF